MSTTITYEYPLNERMRTFLRLEQLYAEMEYFISLESPQGLRVAVDRLLEIINTTAKNDIKAEILKELARHNELLKQLESVPEVDIKLLNRYRNEITRCIRQLESFVTPVANIARQDDFLRAVAQRNKMLGAFCTFDMPTLHNWLQQSTSISRAFFANWITDIRPAIEAISVILELLRSSETTEIKIAQQGFYQEKLDRNNMIPMLIVKTLDNSLIYPEISGHNSTFTIRFMQTSSRGKIQTVTNDIRFAIGYCNF